MALDLLHDEVLVTSFTIIDRYHFTTSVIVYERTAGGEAVPSRTILGEPSGVAGPMLGIAVDPVHNELFVAHSSNNSVAVYDRTADGTVSPLRTISGDASGLDRPFALALWMAAPVPPSPTNATP
jgi:DNA-binding beta-propeller fold protein YncE